MFSAKILLYSLNFAPEAEEHFGQDSVLQRFEQQRLALHC
ncbi:hypothetical protein SynBMKMC1_00323 [Synechococcus sp. BMK-MC-1]|nr:hypothetical protein SynBMKMC1_00323 [Synechococcus sp. BMK-MC-1]